MTTRRRIGALASAGAILCVLALPASAQITTGTVAGSINDTQGAVVPGATVTLINAARGTTTDAQSSVQGDFVFPNVTPGTYTIRSHPGRLQDARAPRHRRQPWRSRRRADADARSRLAGGDGDGHGGVAGDPVVDGRTLLHGRPRLGRQPAARAIATSPRWPRWRQASDGTARIGGGGATNFMMDGVGTMDTGSNRLLMAVNVESIAEVKVLTSSYQAEYGRSSGLQITAVTKSGTNRFRGSRLRRGAQLRLELEQQGEQAQRRSEERSRSSGTGATRSAARSGSRAATTSCSSSTRRSINREQPATTSSGSACRRRSSGRATSRRRPTTTGISSTLIRDASTGLPCMRQADATAAASRMAACSARIPAEPSLSDRA